jgi:hypothetical protein
MMHAGPTWAIEAVKPTATGGANTWASQSRGEIFLGDDYFQRMI